MRSIRVRATAAGLTAGALAALAVGCDFNPAKFVSRNACDILNCEVLFFVDEIFPLSAAPAAPGGGAAAPAAPAAGGHVH
jgi:hypothetical protein